MSGKRRREPGNSNDNDNGNGRRSAKVAATVPKVAATVPNAVPNAIPNEPHNMGQPADPILLFVSDLEGCATGYSRVLCSNEFFEALRTFLTDTENEVAFLGDYFDKGDLVAQSINNIVALNREFPDRVHIILGNRDLNKLRLIYEMKPAAQLVGENKWADWNTFYTNLPGAATFKARMSIIHSQSMGANYPVVLAPELTEDQANYYLLKAFSNANATTYGAHELPEVHTQKATCDAFVTNCQELYKKGHIVKYSPRFKTLLSHAGGMDPFFFHTAGYYTTVKGKATASEYYSKIEQMRLALQVRPEAGQVDPSFHEETYNAPLRSIIDTLFTAAPEIPDPNLLLLQALGLKPSAGQQFVSFVQSCDSPNGCKGPISTDMPPYNKEDYEAYMDRLVASGIHFVAAGHIPHCAPIPMIYKRGDKSKPVFIANDTSNGNRPAAIANPTQVPLAYVKVSGVAGVGSLPSMSTADTYKTGYEVMVQAFTEENMPTFVEQGNTSYIKYGEGQLLVFPARKPGGGYAKATISAAPLVAGGGRRRRHKTQKRSKKSKKSKKSRRPIR